MLIQEQWLFLQDVANLLIQAKNLGFICTAGELWRPEVMAWVNSLPSNSKLSANTPTLGILEYSVPVGGRGILKSKHRDRFAIDLNLFMANDLTKLCTIEQIKPLGEYWESLSPDNRWGGNFSHPDVWHFERNV